MSTNCPLCNNTSDIFYKYKNRLYLQCSNCKGIFVDSNLILSNEDEKLRYESHNNDIEDIRFQKFVSPITTSIVSNFTPNDKGLDFGAGTGPVISKILTDNKFNIQLYDPFFHNFPNLLVEKYNYIACCEVIEHFNNPDKEFRLLKSLLLSKGKLFCMTDIYSKSIDFHTWYYKNDSTHVFIYQKETMYWIKEKYGFLDVKIDGRLVIFSI